MSTTDPSQQTAPGGRVYLIVLPWSHVMRPGATVQFRLSVCDDKGKAVPSRPRWNAQGGSIDAQGFFTAGHTLGLFQVSVIDELSGEASKASVDIQDHHVEESLLSRPPYRPEPIAPAAATQGKAPAVTGADSTTYRRSPAAPASKAPPPALVRDPHKAADAVTASLRGKDGATGWEPILDPDEAFYTILGLRQGTQRYRFYVKVLAESSPVEVCSVLDYAEAALEHPPGDGMREIHSYLLMGPGLDVDPRVEILVRTFNERMWVERDSGAGRAYVAYTGLDRWLPKHPGVVDPEPDIRKLVPAPAPLPVPVPVPVPAPTATAPDAAKPAGPQATGRPNVLVVDDSPLVLDMMKDVLRPSGYVVYHASDWASFREAILNARFAVILLDVSMPGLTGDKMALFAGQFLQPPRPRILLHSGLPEAELRRLARRVGAHSYICKGVESGELLRIVDAAVKAHLEDAVAVS